MYCVIKGAAPPADKRNIKCRSYKHIDEGVFSVAVGVIPSDVACVFDEVLVTSTGLMKSSLRMF